jgi:aminoglycoside 3-N-acetyltransferase
MMTIETIQGPPKTEKSLRQDLLTIGVEREMTLMVHSSLSSIGWVVGGPSTVVRALLDVMGGQGTLAMPAATPHCADPARWSAPKVPDAWLEEVREALPVFDPQTTPTTLGAIAETFRIWPGTLRSYHPLESVCARGALASEITREHSLAFSEGRGGPFGKLYDLDSWILLLGVGFNRCTALHFAESLVEKRRTTTVRFPTLDGGRRVWLEVPNVADDNDTHFPIIGKEYLAAGQAKVGSIGDAQSTLFSMRDLVDFAVRYFEAVLPARP